MTAQLDWVELLSGACARTSQRRVAARIGYSPATVSLVLAGRYTGDLATVEHAVRSILEAPVECPELGAIPAAECRLWQERSLTFVNSDRQRVEMFRACRRCPRSQEIHDEAS